MGKYFKMDFNKYYFKEEANLLSQYKPRPKAGVDPYTFQDSNAERIVHGKHDRNAWQTGNQYRHVLEYTGDILREFSQDIVDVNYIDQKIGTLERYMKSESYRLLYRIDAKKENLENINLLIKAYEDQPTDTPEQELARQLVLELAKGNWKEVERHLNVLKQLVSEADENSWQWGITHGNKKESK